jgi:glycosyltransferase involved in cell wall biosynthesis
MARVSIIMACKDTAPYIRSCLDSILAQTYTDWELIAVNDHSSDDTPLILAEYAAADERVRYFDSPVQKLNGTLIFALEQANGELVNRMDSDDRMPADKIESLVNAWEAHGAGTVIGGGTEHFVDEGEVGGGFRRYEQWINAVAREGRHAQEIYKECVIPSHSWMVHIDDLRAVGGFADTYPEDYDLCFRFYQHGLNLVGIDKVLHYWRDRGDRISRTWEVYRDNRYFEMKLKYFYLVDRDQEKELVLWGAGRNGKDLAKLLLDREESIRWVCDNENKIGKDVYGVVMEPFSAVQEMENCQVIVCVASPEGQEEIREQLAAWGKEPGKDYWSFS